MSNMNFGLSCFDLRRFFLNQLRHKSRDYCTKHFGCCHMLHIFFLLKITFNKLTFGLWFKCIAYSFKFFFTYRIFSIIQVVLYTTVGICPHICISKLSSPISYWKQQKNRETVKSIKLYTDNTAVHLLIEHL